MTTRPSKWALNHFRRINPGGFAASYWSENLATGEHHFYFCGTRIATISPCPSTSGFSVWCFNHPVVRRKTLQSAKRTAYDAILAWAAVVTEVIHEKVN